MKKLILLIGMMPLLSSVSYGMLTCGICKKENKKFQCRKRLDMAVHLINIHNLWSCPHCRERIEDYLAYKQHVRDRHGRRTCSMCAMLTFKDEEAYQSHKDAVHLSPLEYNWECNDCKTRFPTLKVLLIHAVVQHKKYACPFCMEEVNNGKNGSAKVSEMKCWKDVKDIYGEEGKDAFFKHMLREHKRYVCITCNMRVFKRQEAYEQHVLAHCYRKTVRTLCNKCKRLIKYDNEGEQMFHRLKHATLFVFLARTFPGNDCCVPFRKNVLEIRGMNEKQEEFRPAKEYAVWDFFIHVAEKHKRCLFCENHVTDEFLKALKGRTNPPVTCVQIIHEARMFMQLNGNTFANGEIPVIPCNMCGSALCPNRKSRLFFAIIKEFPLGKGLRVPNYPFHHLEYDERKVAKNAMMSVIKEVPANEEESCFIPKKDEKDDIVSGEEDSEEEEEEEEKEEEEEDKKEEKTEEAKELEAKDGK